jgi:hypothetical protein
MSVIINGTTGVTSPGGDSSAVSVTTPKVTNAGTLALEATGANIITVSTNGSERLRIDTSDNLLVGTTTAFDVTSGSDTGVNVSGSGRIDLSRSAGACLGLRRQTNNGAVAAFTRDTTQVGGISITTTATTYNTSSDYRLKEDAQPMENSVDRLMALKPVNFAWKVDGSRVDGFLAHEAQEVVPEAVTGEKDAVDADGKPEYQGIDQSKFVPLLTAALQEAVAEISSLKARIEALEQA